MENYLGIKMKKLLIHTTWMILNSIMLHERSQMLKTAYYILYDIQQKAKLQ